MWDLAQKIPRADDYKVVSCDSGNVTVLLVAAEIWQVNQRLIALS